MEELVKEFLWQFQTAERNADISHTDSETNGFHLGTCEVLSLLLRTMCFPSRYQVAVVTLLSLCTH
jgi:hypothetical protein